MRARAYALAGLRVSSDFEIPELPDGDDEAAAPDVSVRLGAVPEHLPGARAHPVFEATASTYLLHGVAVARYLVRDGSEVVVQPAAAADMRAVRVFLLGPCLRALCHQRGLMPLRAAAVDVGGRAVALAGPSMSGKSTLAAFLQKAGFPALADDVCILGFDPQGRPVVLPSVPRLRLWGGVLRQLGLEPNGRPPDRAGIPRFSIPFPAVRAARPLARVYLIDHRPPAGARPRPVASLGAARALAIVSSIRAFTDPMGKDADHFALVLRLLAGGVEVVDYPRRGKPSGTAERLARDLARLAS